MTWASHMLIGGAAANLFNLNYFLSVFGSIFPDLAEMVIPKDIKHRGITHSLSLWLLSLGVSWFVPVLRDVVLGVVIGHLLADSLTPAGIPIFDESSKHITIFGGKIKTASPAEFVVSFLIAFIAFFLLPSFSLSNSINKRNWKALYESEIIDRKEFDEYRFKLF